MTLKDVFDFDFILHKQIKILTSTFQYCKPPFLVPSVSELFMQIWQRNEFRWKPPITHLWGSQCFPLRAIFSLLPQISVNGFGWIFKFTSLHRRRNITMNAKESTSVVKEMWSYVWSWVNKWYSECEFSNCEVIVKLRRFKLEEFCWQLAPQNLKYLRKFVTKDRSGVFFSFLIEREC